MQSSSPTSRRRLKVVESNTPNSPNVQLFKNKSHKILHIGSDILGFSTPKTSTIKKQDILEDKLTSSPNHKLTGVRNLEPISNFSPKKRTVSSIRGSIQKDIGNLYDHQSERNIRLNLTSEKDHGFKLPLHENKKNGIDALRVFPLDNKGYKISNHEKFDISPIPATRLNLEKRAPSQTDKRLSRNASSPFISTAKGSILSNGQMNSGRCSPAHGIPMTTTHRSDFKPWESQYVKHKGREPTLVTDNGIFTGRTSYNSTYLDFGSPKTQVNQPIHQKTVFPELPFIGQTTYKQSFVNHAGSKPARKKEQQQIKSPFAMGVPLVVESSNSRMFKPFIKNSSSRQDDGKDEHQLSESFLNQFQAANSRVLDSSLDMKNAS